MDFNDPNHNTGTAVDIRLSPGAASIEDSSWFTSTYHIPMGAEGYRAFEEALKQYPYTPEEAIEKQEEKPYSFFESLTAIKK